MTPSMTSDDRDGRSVAEQRAATVRDIWSTLQREPLGPDDASLTELYLTGEQFWWAKFWSEDGDGGEDSHDAEEEEQGGPPGLEAISARSDWIIYAEWFGYAVGELYLQTWKVRAHDLADGLLYVVAEDTFNESRRLIAIGSKQRSSSLFRDVQISWVDEVGWEGDAPTTLFAQALGEPFMLRALAKYSGAGAMELFMLKDNDTEAYEHLRSLWHGAVTQEPAVDGEEIPPGLRGMASSDFMRNKRADLEQFWDWFDSVTLRWRDTRETLSLDDAEHLATACSYVAAVRMADMSSA